MDQITIYILIGILVFAVAIIYLIRSKRSVSTDQLYSNALFAMLKGDNIEATKLLKKVVNNDSDNIGAYLQLGNLLRAEHPNQATKIHQSLTIRPKLSKQISMEIHQALALDYMEIKNFKRAKIEAEMVFKYDKNSLWANKLLLQIAEIKRDWDKASEFATKIQKLTKEYNPRQIAEIKLQAGLDHLQNGRNKDALKYFEDAVNLDPSFSTPYLYIGNIYGEDKKLKRAMLNWEKYLVNVPSGDAKIYKKIESALFELDRFNEIEQFYTRMLSNNPNESIAIAKLTNLLVEKGDNEGAIKLVEDAIANNNELVPVRLIKLKILLEKANPIDLKNQIDQILEIIGK